VFFDASEPLSLAELQLTVRRFDTRCENVRVEELEGLRLYCFDAEHVLSSGDLCRVSAVSSLYALFVREGGALHPTRLHRYAPFREDLSAIPKYTGKTNALFTRLLLHIAELSLPGEHTAPLRLLDPVAGKGTTLFEALMRGFDAFGIEIVAKAAHDAAVYFQKYLETERMRHKPHKEKLYGAPSWKFQFAADKQTLHTAPGEWMMVAGDSKDADRYFGKCAFDIVVGDLPYGVVHGNIAGARPSRSPEALLRACLPAWRTVLRPDGVLALSWNTLVFGAEKMAAVLAENGFACFRDVPYGAFAHRVDASIRRDIVVARK
ncbi:MAG: hypothetical protein FWG37_06890, partial [Clostridia bacterium]|nr:hypothetical protein [Clostridia bacterium]